MSEHTLDELEREADDLCRTIDELKTGIRAAQQGENEAMALVLSHEGHIEKLEQRERALCSLLGCEPDALVERVRQMREAALVFLAKHDECTPHVENAFLLAQIHGQPYTGPNYAAELKALREDLSVTK